MTRRQKKKLLRKIRKAQAQLPEPEEVVVDGVVRYRMSADTFVRSAVLGRMEKLLS